MSGAGGQGLCWDMKPRWHQHSASAGGMRNRKCATQQCEPGGVEYALWISILTETPGVAGGAFGAGVRWRLRNCGIDGALPSGETRAAAC